MGPGPVYTPPPVAIVEVKAEGAVIAAVIAEKAVGPKTIKMKFSGDKLPGHMFGAHWKILVQAQHANSPLKDVGQTEVQQHHNPSFSTHVSILRQPDTKLTFWLLNGDHRDAKIEYQLHEMLASNPWKYPFSDTKTGYRLPEAHLIVQWEEIA